MNEIFPRIVSYTNIRDSALKKENGNEKEVTKCTFPCIYSHQSQVTRKIPSSKGKRNLY